MWKSNFHFQLFLFPLETKKRLTNRKDSLPKYLFLILIFLREIQHFCLSMLQNNNNDFKKCCRQIVQGRSPRKNKSCFFQCFSFMFSPFTFHLCFRIHITHTVGSTPLFYHKWIPIITMIITLRHHHHHHYYTAATIRVQPMIEVPLWLLMIISNNIIVVS